MNRMQVTVASLLLKSATVGALVVPVLLCLFATTHHAARDNHVDALFVPNILFCGLLSFVANPPLQFKTVPATVFLGALGALLGRLGWPPRLLLPLLVTLSMVLTVASTAPDPSSWWVAPISGAVCGVVLQAVISRELNVLSKGGDHDQ